MKTFKLSTNVRILLAGLSLFITLICWSLSAPLNSHGDERFHIGSIWCASKNEDLCERLGRNKVNFEVAIIKADFCVPPNIEETYKRLLIQQSRNSCQYEINPSSIDKLDNNPNNYFDQDGSIGVWIQPGHTPSFYYKFMNLFVSENAVMSIILMRIINALIFCVLFIALLIIADNRVFISALIALSLTIIPHGIFLVSGINPSSWAFTGTALNWGFLFIIMNSRLQFKLKTLVALLAWLTTLTLVLTSRYDAIIYVLFSNALLIGMKIFGPKLFNLTRLTIGLLTGLVSFLILRTQFSGLRGLFAPNPLYSNQISDLIVVFGNAVKVSIATPLRILGLQPPGWLFDSLPRAVFFSGLLLAIITLYQIVESKNQLQKKVSYLIMSFYFLVILSQTYMRRDWTTPFYLIRTGWAGDVFNSRYFLPIFPFFIGMIAIYSKTAQILFNKNKFKNIVITVLTLSHTLTLYKITEIFRENPSWYWRNFPIGIGSIFVLGSLTFFGFISIVFYASKEVNEERTYSQ